MNWTSLDSNDLQEKLCRIFSECNFLKQVFHKNTECVRKSYQARSRAKLICPSKLDYGVKTRGEVAETFDSLSGPVINATAQK